MVEKHQEHLDRSIIVITPQLSRNHTIMSSSSSTTSTTPNATSSISPSITQEGSAGFFPPDVVHAAKDVLSSIVGSAMCVYTGQPFDTGKWRDGRKGIRRGRRIAGGINDACDNEDCTSLAHSSSPLLPSCSPPHPQLKCACKPDLTHLCPLSSAS